MSLLSSAPFSNVTTYRKDYYKKSVPKPPKNRPIPEYENPLLGPYEEYVLPCVKYQQLEPYQTKYPDPKEYAEEVAANYPSTRRLLQGTPTDFDAIDKLYENENRTVYMVSYCKLKDFDSKSKRERTTGTLPEGWVVPLTTQKCSYRNPFVLSPEGIQTLPKAHPTDNLSPNKKEREILQVKTGESIYISDISNLGKEIIDGKLHGDVNIRPQFDQEDLIKAQLLKLR